MVASTTLCFVSVMLCYIASYHTEALLFKEKIQIPSRKCEVSNWDLGRWAKTGSTLTLIHTRKVILSPQTLAGTRCPRLRKNGLKIQFTTRGTARSLLKYFYNLKGRGPTRSIKTKFSTKGFFASSAHSSNRDILLVVDSSGSIGSTKFNSAKPEIANLLGMVCPAPDPFASHHQVALIQFSKSIQEKFDFNDKANTLAVKNGINSMVYDGSSTCTKDALEKAYDMFQASKGMRPGVKHELLLLSDGKPDCPGSGMSKAEYKTKAVAAADKLRNEKGVEIYALVIGNNAAANLNEMMKYVSAPLNTHLFALEDYQELKELAGLVKDGIDNGEFVIMMNSE